MEILYTKEQIDKIMKIRDQFSKTGENLQPNDGSDGVKASEIIYKQKMKQAQRKNKTSSESKRKI